MIQSTIRLSIALAILGGPALAQQPVPSTQPVKVVEFLPEDVNGGAQNPDIQVEEVILRRPTGSLVKVRTDFRQRMLQSAQSL